MKLTIDDIAKICGVSKGTVNRAIHNKADINENTKERILKVIKELNFQPDYLAKTLATGKTDIIGIILPSLDNEFFTMLYTKIEKICWEKGYFMSLALSNNDLDKERKYIRSFIDRRVDGLIIFPINKDASMIKEAMAKNISTVIVFNDIPGIDTNVIKINEYSAMSDTVQYLIDIGHKRIAYIDGFGLDSPQYNDYIKAERYKAFKDTMIKNYIMYRSNCYIQFDPQFKYEDDFTMLEKLVKGDGRPTAIVCFQDQIALWTIRGLKRLGISVPQDISVTGFDNINEIKYFEPSLTTNRMPVTEIAEEAITFLIDDIENKKKGSRKVSFDAELILRDSCRPI